MSFQNAAAEKLRRLDDSIERWQRRLVRATLLLEKLRKRRRRLEVKAKAPPRAAIAGPT